jgi:hypothetical protein
MSATVHFRQGLSVARDEFRAEHSAHRLRHETLDFCAFRLFTHGGWLVSRLGFGQRVHRWASDLSLFGTTVHGGCCAEDLKLGSISIEIRCLHKTVGWICGVAGTAADIPNVTNSW